MITQRRLGILVAAVALLLGHSAFAKRANTNKPKPASAQDPWTESEETPTPAPAAEKATPPAETSAHAAETSAHAAETSAHAAETSAQAAETSAHAAEVAPVTAPMAAHAAKQETEEGAPVVAKPAAAEPTKSNGNADSPEGVTWTASGWDVTLYGYAALNVMQDSTQSFGTGIGNTIIQRRGTVRGNNLQAQASARDSRLGLRLAAPAYGSIHSSVNLETDFNNTPPIEYTESNAVTNAGFRMRHYYMKIETPIIDILAGQYHDLFGWGGKGFYPSTLGFLGLPGEVYHRQPQIRLSKTLASSAVEFEIAGAVLRPVQKSGGYPDVEAGLRLALNKWTGVRQQAYGQPGIGAMSIGVSGIGRHFEVAHFIENASTTDPGTGWGLAANIFLPIIPASNAKKRGNSLSLTGEFSRGTGISDMYTDLTGGLLFPSLATQNHLDATDAPPVYSPNIDSGIVTFDGNNRLRTCDWQGFVAGFQYYLPILSGRVWISGVHSQIMSDNIVEITPLQGRGGVYKHAWYYDGSLFIALTDAIQIAGSFQVSRQTLGDDVQTQNYRSEFGMMMFF
jgi:hypothetical protein